MIWIDITEEPRKEVYRKLIEYACEINDTLKFKGPSISLYKEYVEERLEEICKILNRNKEEIMDNYYDEEFMEELYNEVDFKLKDRRDLIWSKELEERREQMMKDGESKEHIKWITSRYKNSSFSYILMLGVFNRNLNILKQKEKENLINTVVSNNEYSMSTVRNYFVR